MKPSFDFLSFRAYDKAAIECNAVTNYEREMNVNSRDGGTWSNQYFLLVSSLVLSWYVFDAWTNWMQVVEAVLISTWQFLYLQMVHRGMLLPEIRSFVIQIMDCRTGRELRYSYLSFTITCDDIDLHCASKSMIADISIWDFDRSSQLRLLIKSF